MQVFNSPCMNDVWTNLLFEGQTQGKLRKTEIYSIYVYTPGSDKI